MAPVQQKFTVIPELPTGRSNGSVTPTGPPSKPPMTTKQAKKLYKAANKGPKLSKAEQRRQDLFEQDQIRKEFEKEKNQARARAARDKRKEKEEKEKAAKRKKGLPLVEVHPSQDTLARFIRPQLKPKPKPKDEPAPPLVTREEDDSDFTLPTESDGEPPLKRRKPASPAPDREAQEKREPSLANSSKSAKRQITTSPAPPRSTESKIERPSKRPKSSSPSRKEGPQWTQDQSLAVFPGSAKQQIPSSPAQQEQVHRQPEPTRSNSPPPKRPEENATPPPQLPSQAQVQTGKPLDYDAEAAEILDLLEQQIANESFSADDFLFTDGPAMQSRPEVLVPAPIAPQLAASPRPGNLSSKSASETTRLDSSNTNSQTRTTPGQALRGQASDVVDISVQDQVSTKLKSTSSSEGPAQTGARLQPGTSSKVPGFRGPPMPKPLETYSKPPLSAANPPHSAESPSKPTQSSSRATAFPKSCSRAPLGEVIPNQAPQIKAGNDEGSAIKKPLERTEPASKTAEPVFRKPDLPRSASKTSREPRTPSMGPPPGPPRFKTPAYQSSGLSGNMPKFISKAPPPPENRPTAVNSPGNISHTMETSAPSSTQLFLSGLEDFFPSPSQELKEIFDDSKCTRRWSRASKSPQPAPSHLMPPPQTNITRTSPATSRKPGRKPLQRNSLCIAQPPAPPVTTALPSCAPAAPKIPANQPNQDDWFPPFSTQDFFFSSQDIREVEDASSSVNSQSVPTEAVVKPAQKALFPSEDCTSGPPAFPVHDEPLARGGGARLSFHKPETMVLAASDCRDSQDPWLNLSSQQSKSSLPETPTGARSGAERRSFNSTLQPRTTQQLGRAVKGGNHTPSNLHVDVNASRVEGVNMDGSPPSKQTGHPSSHSTSPQKSLEALRPSPKPFFTSSGTKELTLLAIEQSKRTAREDEFARQRQKDDEMERQRLAQFAQRRREMQEAKCEEAARLEEAVRLEEAARLEEAVRLAKEESVRLAKENEARLAREEAARLALLEQQDQRDRAAKAVPQGRPTEVDQEGSELEDDGIEQLLLEGALDDDLMSDGPAQTKKSPPGIFSTRKPTGNTGGFRGRSEGSFEKMMALAHKQVSRRSQDQPTRNIAPAEPAVKHQAAVMASQETDYGDAEWDECDLDGFL